MSAADLSSSKRRSQPATGSNWRTLVTFAHTSQTPCESGERRALAIRSAMTDCEREEVRAVPAAARGSY